MITETFQPDLAAIPMTIESWEEDEEIVEAITVRRQRFSVELAIDGDALLYRLSREFTNEGYRVRTEVYRDAREQLRILFNKRFGRGAFEYEVETRRGAEFKLRVNDGGRLRAGNNVFVGYIELDQEYVDDLERQMRGGIQ